MLCNINLDHHILCSGRLLLLLQVLREPLVDPGLEHVVLLALLLLLPRLELAHGVDPGHGALELVLFVERRTPEWR